MPPDSEPEAEPNPPPGEFHTDQGTAGLTTEPEALKRSPLSRTVLKALRLKPAPGQKAVQRVWSRRRREYIELFDPALCVPMRAARTPSAAQLAALQAGRRTQTHADCAGCGRNLERVRLNQQGICSECVSSQEAEEASSRQEERRADLRALVDAAPPGRTVYLDTETTGLSAASGDELLELAVIDDAGKVLFETLIRPNHLTEWPAAQVIHGITPADVAGAPSLSAVLQGLAAAIEGAEALVIFNADFDLGFLPEPLRPLAKQKARCAMQAFALWCVEWDDYRYSYRWQNLQQAAAIAGHVWEGRAHRARADAFAVRTVWHWLRAAVVAG
jgi:DNA polymerase-3 subunit epsilon